MIDSQLYPVSNEIRSAVLLDGLWRFRFDPQGVGRAEKWAEKGLPDPISMPVPASFSDLFTEAWQRDYCGDFWYETDVSVQEIRPGRLTPKSAPSPACWKKPAAPTAAAASR